MHWVPLCLLRRVPPNGVLQRESPGFKVFWEKMTLYLFCLKSAAVRSNIKSTASSPTSNAHSAYKRQNLFICLPHRAAERNINHWSLNWNLQKNTQDEVREVWTLLLNVDFSSGAANGCFLFLKELYLSTSLLCNHYCVSSNPRELALGLTLDMDGFLGSLKHGSCLVSAPKG